MEKAQQRLLSLEQEHHGALNSAQAAQQLHQEELESLQVMCSEVKEQLQLVEMELRTTTEERSRLQEGLKRLRDDLGEGWQVWQVFCQLRLAFVYIRRYVCLCAYM